MNLIKEPCDQYLNRCTLERGNHIDRLLTTSASLDFIIKDSHPVLILIITDQNLNDYKHIQPVSFENGNSTLKTTRMSM